MELSVNRARLPQAFSSVVKMFGDDNIVWPGFPTHFVASGAESLAGKKGEPFDRKRIVHTVRIEWGNLTLPGKT